MVLVHVGVTYSSYALGRLSRRLFEFDGGGVVDGVKCCFLVFSTRSGVNGSWFLGLFGPPDHHGKIFYWSLNMNTNVSMILYERVLSYAWRG